MIATKNNKRKSSRERKFLRRNRIYAVRTDREDKNLKGGKKEEEKEMIRNGSFTDLKIPQVYFIRKRRKKEEEATVGRSDRSERVHEEGLLPTTRTTYRRESK